MVDCQFPMVNCQLPIINCESSTSDQASTRGNGQPATVCEVWEGRQMVSRWMKWVAMGPFELKIGPFEPQSLWGAFGQVVGSHTATSETNRFLFLFLSKNIFVVF
mgnify:CR=1 FL=1